jgi:hypothetical protein
MTIDIGTSVTVTRPRLPERDPTQPYVLNMMLRKTLHVLKEALVEVTLGQHLLRTWAFVTEAMHKFFLRLDVCMLQQGEEGMPLWCSRV